MDSEIEQNVRRLMSDIFDMPEDSISEEASKDNIEGWDSANHIQLIIALEEQFSISFDVAEFELIRSYADIVQMVQSKL